MNNNKIFWINIFMTLLFLGFNIIVTYNADLDDFFLLITGLTILISKEHQRERVNFSIYKNILCYTDNSYNFSNTLISLYE